VTLPITEDVLVIQLRANRKPHDYRCGGCGRLLFRAVLLPGCYIEIRCRHCTTMSVHTYQPNDGDYLLIDKEEKTVLEDN